MFQYVGQFYVTIQEIVWLFFFAQRRCVKDARCAFLHRLSRLDIFVFSCLSWNSAGMELKLGRVYLFSYSA
jgi:hypothetical protein